MKQLKMRIILVLFSLGISIQSGVSEVTVLDEKNFSFQVSGASTKSVLELVAKKADLQAELSGEFADRVDYSFKKTTLREALDVMGKDLGFSYSVSNGKLLVNRSASSGRGLASTGTGNNSIRILDLKYVDADEMATKIKPLLGTGEEVYVDKSLNTLALASSTETFNKIQEFTAIFDRLPSQIMIEAKIVETNDNFSRDLGFLAGDLSDSTMNNTSKVTGLSTPSVSTAPFFRAKYRIGIMDSRSLDLRLIAAESKGDAKVISKPKVVTINNTRATINSGLIFNVKTLSNESTSTNGTTSTVTGGLTRVEAGLQLGVLPSIINNTLVRLLVDVNNSEPDNTIPVDGIPGISTNSANTSIIVQNGNTAVIAGLIKNSKSNSRTGVPFLSDIPILGMLFRSDGKSERNNELVILITPKILENPGDLPLEQPSEVATNLIKEDSKVIQKEEDKTNEE
jgi:type IV pilus assembly protein PilQ